MVDKRLFEELRGEPILENGVDPTDVPCLEVSDMGRLCPSPLVSVYMTAYNHARYVRKAIECVMAQEADFGYELIIGEDCSADETREICLEYQRRYPDRIRVLWWHENVSRLGGNGNRILGKCRGEYVATCEGDDYWTDSKKLQKQIDLLRAHPSAGSCFGGVDFLTDATGKISRYDPAQVPEEFLDGREFARRMLFECGARSLYLQSLHFSAYLVRRDILMAARRRFPEIHAWYLRFSDYIKFLSGAALADVCFLREPVSVYRLHGFGMTARNEGRLMRDGDVGRVYFAMTMFGLTFDESVDAFADRLAIHWVKSALREDSEGQRAMGKLLLASPVMRRIFSSFRCRPFLDAICAGRLTRRRYKVCRLWFSLVSHVRGRRKARVTGK